jgi:hypothetical protein
MIQRYLYTALVNGLEAIRRDPSILDELFEDLYELDSTEMTAIRKWFADKPPSVYHGYARADYKFPLYTIVLQSEGEDKMMIGDEADQITDSGDPDFGADAYAALWRHTYHILCYSEHPDATLYMYEVVKAIILRSHDYFIQRDLWGIQVSGMDIHVDPKYIPEYLFVRQLVFSCEREFRQVDKASRKGKAFKIGGLFVDKSGSPSDVGEVKTLVYPYVPEE